MNPHSMYQSYNSYLHPFSLSVLKAPAMILESRIPMVMNSWLTVTRDPRMCEGAASAT